MQVDHLQVFLPDRASVNETDKNPVLILKESLQKKKNLPVAFFGFIFVQLVVYGFESLPVAVKLGIENAGRWSTDDQRQSYNQKSHFYYFT